MADQDERLEALKTLHETRANDQFVEALVFEIPAKLASRTLGIVKPVLQEAPKQPQLHHLRRLIHLPHLPKDLLERRVVITRPGLPCIFLIQVATQDLADAILTVLREAIDSDAGLKSYDHVPRCFPIIVPLHAPLNEQQSKLWSERYWPCIYNPASQVLQDAPPLHLLRKIRTELDTETTDEYLDLAQIAAGQAALSGHGLALGAVIVDPNTKEVVAVAGDARFFPRKQENATNCGPGRPEYHALMRAINMVANKELKRRLAVGSHTKFASTCSEGKAGQPFSPVEEHYVHDPTITGQDEIQTTINLPARQSAVRNEGYLCSGLDVYLTHEPCVCCAMAMIHSRFRACVFINRMSCTGALCARTHEANLGYGLFWRRELNWRVITFQYKSPGQIRTSVCKEMFHA